MMFAIAMAVAALAGAAIQPMVVSFVRTVGERFTVSWQNCSPARLHYAFQMIRVCRNTYQASDVQRFAPLCICV
jgi:hypothetical protein